MKVLAVIPARYGSKRFKGKVIADLLGKPLLQHVFENVKKCRIIDRVVIATDDIRVKAVAEKFGAEVVMTSKTLTSGTERIIEVAKKNKENSIIVNVQGDEPVLDMKDVSRAIKVLKNNKKIQMATLFCKLEKKADIENPNIVKVIKDKDNFAIYFSRFPIPYIRERSDQKKACYYKHLGIYCYQKDFLLKFKKLSYSMLEEVEKLEQLRILENGYRIKMVEAKHDSVGVDTKEDLEKVKKHILGNKKIKS